MNPHKKNRYLKGGALLVGLGLAIGLLVLVVADFLNTTAMPPLAFLGAVLLVSFYVFNA